MSDFDLKALALFTNSAGRRVVKIIQILDLDPAHDYIVHAVGGTAYFAHHSELEPLPDGTPVFAAGNRVVVADAGRTGTVSAPEFRGDLFGYWIDLDDTGEHVWVPAEMLMLAEDGESR